MPRSKRVAPPAHLQAQAAEPDIVAAETPAPEIEAPADAVTAPTHWPLGALLNVRNTGADYVITLYPEEFDPRRPERALRFTNPGRCQDFVSRWYARQHHDPRAH